MKDYRLAAFDMDGTLLTNRKDIMPETLKSIADADEAGKSVVICTGRPLAELRPYQKDFTHIRYAMCECGAFLYDYKERRTITHHTIPADQIEEILEIMKLEDMMPQALIHGESYVSRNDLKRMDYFQMGVYQSLYDEVATPVDDIYDVIYHHASEIEKLNCYHASAEGRERTMERLRDIHVEKTYAERTSLELSAPGISKGSGLIELARVLNIPIRSAIAVGDADNDVPMIRAAGLGVAMGNANAHAKEAADYITLDNEHDGCGHVIRSFMLND